MAKRECDKSEGDDTRLIDDKSSYYSALLGGLYIFLAATRNPALEEYCNRILALRDKT